MNERIALVYGGPSKEKEISECSALNVEKALTGKGYDVKKIDLTRNFISDLRKTEAQKVFLILHGNPGEDGSVQGLLDLEGIPYTYSGVLASALALDKHKCKSVLESAGLPVLPDKMIRKSLLPDQDDTAWTQKNLASLMDFPMVLKPNKEGSSVGIVLCKEPEDFLPHVRSLLKEYDEIMAEKFISGREITIGVLEEKGRSRALPVLELKPKNEFYDFEAKYTRGMTEFIVPAPLDKGLTEQVQTASEKAFDILGCRGAARVDMMVRDGKFFILEVNTIPGMTETSDLPMAAKADGIRFDDLVEGILKSAGRGGVSW